jgi:hypothetical protein
MLLLLVDHARPQQTQVIPAPKHPGSKGTRLSTLNRYLTKFTLQRAYLSQMPKQLRKNMHLSWLYFLQLMLKLPTTLSSCKLKVKERRYTTDWSKSRICREGNPQLGADWVL